MTEYEVKPTEHPKQDAGQEKPQPNPQQQPETHVTVDQPGTATHVDVEQPKHENGEDDK
jgi:hypothetical protein